MLKEKILTGFISLILASTLSAKSINEQECSTLGSKYIFAGGECIQTVVYKGETEGALNVVVHGTWKEGTNTLARYAPFAENLSMQTDVTTVAVALPGYSNSSTNNFKALSHEGVENLAAQKPYIEFLNQLIIKLKEKYNAQTLTYIGHSAGAMMGATLSAYNPTLLTNGVFAGGRYDIHEKVPENKNLVSIIDYIDSANKDMKYVLVYGSEDKISEPKVTIDFYKLAQSKGLDVKLVEVKGAPHLDLDMSDKSVEAIMALYE